MVVFSMLAALSYALVTLGFPLLPNFPFLKLDFGDIPVLIGTFIYGISGGVSVAFIRSLLHFVITGAGMLNLVGDFASFLATVLYLIPIHLIYQKKKGKKNAFLSVIIATVFLTIFMTIANYFVLTPLYVKLLGFNYGIPMKQVMITGIIPFNLIKGLVVGGIYVVIQQKMLAWLSSKLYQNKKIQ